jgi:hypothetical protein
MASVRQGHRILVKSEGWLRAPARIGHILGRLALRKLGLSHLIAVRPLISRLVRPMRVTCRLTATPSRKRERCRTGAHIVVRFEVSLNLGLRVWPALRSPPERVVH